MRKTVIIITAVFLVHLTALTAFAGTINPEEARIIDAASGYFDYQGQEFVATEAALSQMTAYLNQDSIDLTKTQADRAIQLMFYEKNIKTAIDGGYIVAVGGGGTDPGSDPGTTNGGTGNGGDPDTNGNGDGDGNGTTNPDGQPVETPVDSGFVKIFFPEGLIQGFDSQEHQVFEAETPIKNTGIDVSDFLIPALILAALAAGLLAYVKKEIRFIVVPLVFVVLLAGLIGTVGAGAKARLLAHVENAMILGAPQVDWDSNLPMFEGVGVPGGDGQYQAGKADIPMVGVQYGNLVCDAIDLSAPLYFGDSEAIFEKGAGQYVMSGIPGEGKPILIGGHDTSFFAPLEDIKKGDEITLNTFYGFYVYKVKEIKIEPVDQWSNKTLNEDQETLILYTCYPFGGVFGARDDRYYVICDKIMGPTIQEGSLNR
jgi:sortase A